MKGISIYNLLSIKSPNIIDIRDSYSYYQGYIKGAINIPYYNLLNNYSHYIKKDILYYLYCDYGKQSYEISERLNGFGYNTISLIGGYEEYKKFSKSL